MCICPIQSAGKRWGVSRPFASFSSSFSSNFALISTHFGFPQIIPYNATAKNSKLKIENVVKGDRAHYKYEKTLNSPRVAEYVINFLIFKLSFLRCVATLKRPGEETLESTTSTLIRVKDK